MVLFGMFNGAFWYVYWFFYEFFTGTFPDVTRTGRRKSHGHIIQRR